jgi:hypothetical protein
MAMKNLVAKSRPSPDVAKSRPSPDVAIPTTKLIGESRPSPDVATPTPPDVEGRRRREDTARASLCVEEIVEIESLSVSASY